jgi:hypothetical protein
LTHCAAWLLLLIAKQNMNSAINLFIAFQPSTNLFQLKLC